jgi:hypothetical protein
MTHIPFYILNYAIILRNHNLICQIFNTEYGILNLFEILEIHVTYTRKCNLYKKI